MFGRGMGIIPLTFLCLFMVRCGKEFEEGRKAVRKTRAVQTLCVCRASPNHAKRVDGSVQTFDKKLLNDSFARTGPVTNRLVIPYFGVR